MNEMIKIGSILSKVAKNYNSRNDEMTLEEYFELVRENPKKYLRSIKQTVSDAVLSKIKVEKDDGNDPESIGFYKIDYSQIFPNFMPDTIFANRFRQKMEGMKIGSTQNKIMIFRGPSGCGKSTFLDDLLSSTENYINSEEGARYEIVWNITKNDKDGTIQIPCPSHDHPIMIIPQDIRVEFIDALLENTEDKYHIISDKEYEWIFTEKACTICESCFHELAKIFGSVEEMLKNVKVRKVVFNRRTGNGITVFGPGDEPLKQFIIGNETLQKHINEYFKDSAKVHYIYSPFAKTNNGIYILTDVKDYNVSRMRKLHNIVSEAVIKAGDKEESVNSLFICIVNHEDLDSINDLKSFWDRVEIIDITYVTDPKVEMQIYKDAFGHDIERLFLPRVFENFAKIIVATRLDTTSEAIKRWLNKDLKRYSKYTDPNGLLIKMDIYSSSIPSWVSEEDIKKLTREIRLAIIKESELDGTSGISGRESVKLFKELMNKHQKSEKPISMEDLSMFFVDLRIKKNKKINDEKDGEAKKKIVKSIPEKSFFDTLQEIYDHSVAEEIKLALYEYNEEQINNDILTYLHAINMDMGTEEKCPWTGEKISANSDFFSIMEKKLFGNMNANIRSNLQKEYIQKTLQEVVHKKTDQEKSEIIKKSPQFKRLKDQYISRLKETSVSSLKDNDNFRNAIADYRDKEKFKTYDKKIKYNVELLLKVLQEKYKYTEEGAISVSIYALDSALFG